MASMSGLPDWGRRVWVGPPLLASGPRPGSPAFSLSVAAVNPHEASSEKLNPFDVVVTPAQLGGGTNSTGVIWGRATTDPNDAKDELDPKMLAPGVVT